MKPLKIKTKIYLMLFFGSVIPLLSSIVTFHQNVIYPLLENTEEDDIYQIIQNTTFLILLECLLIIVTFILFKNSIEKSFNELEDGLRKIANGDTNYKLKISNNEEFKKLATIINEVVKKTKNVKKEIEEKLEIQTKKLKENQKTLEVQQEALLNVLEDIEEEKKNAEKKQKQLDTILQSVGEGILVLDEKKKIIMANRELVKMTGYTKKEIEGHMINKWKPLSEKKDSQKSKAMEEIVEEIYEKNKSEVSREDLFLVTKKGTYLAINTYATAVKNKNEKTTGCVITIRDTSKEREINRMKSEFVSVASHQLRTPLTSLNWYLELLLSGESGKITKEQKEYLENAYEETKRMSELVTELLNVSRIETGQIKIEKKKINIEKLIKETIKEVEFFSKRKNIEIQTENIQKIGIVEGDQNLLHQVFHNILTNSIKYSPENSKVAINAKKGNQGIEISIKDNGIGIPKEVQKHIFEKFFRANNARTIQTDGNGLGLYIAKMILEAHKGKIYFESNGKKGTVFFISLPLHL